MKTIIEEKYSGMSYCQVCHKSFISDDPKAINNHKKIHKIFLNGIIANELISDEVIFDDGNFRIIVILPESVMNQRNRAERIARRVHSGTHYDQLSFYAVPIDRKTIQFSFIGVVKQHAISFLVMREITKSIKIIWDEHSLDNPFSKEIQANHEKRWCLDMIWTLNKYRGHGYAKLTIEQALKYLCKPIYEMAWLQPFTENGKLLAKSMSPNEIFIPD